MEITLSKDHKIDLRDTQRTMSAIPIISRNDFRANRSLILDQFQDESVWSDIHSLETPDEFYCSLYFIVHHSQVSEKPVSDFAQLCKHLILSDPWDDISKSNANDIPTYLMEEFSDLNSEWNTRELVNSDISRMLEIISRCTSTIGEKDGCIAWQSGRASGYYLNDEYVGSEYPMSVLSSITAMTGGLVLDSSGSDLVCLGKVERKLVLFHWVSSA